MVNFFKRKRIMSSVSIVSQKYQKLDGWYFDIKTPCVIEPIPILARELYKKHFQYLSLDDIKHVTSTIAEEKRYTLVYITDNEFILVDKYTGKQECVDLSYVALSKYPENSLSFYDIVKIVQQIERVIIEKNTENINIYKLYDIDGNGNIEYLRLVK